MNKLRTTLALGTTLLMAATACANDPVDIGSQPGNGTGSGTIDIGNIQLISSLTRFDQCDDLVGYLRSEMLTAIENGTYGGYGYGGIAETDIGVMDDAVGAPAANERASSGGDSDTTGTNNQETGVDEADYIKTDGNRILTLRGNKLFVVSLVDGAPSLEATVFLGNLSGRYLFLDGDRAYIAGDTYNNENNGQPGISVGEDLARSSSYYNPTTTLVEVALDGTPRLLQTAVLDGNVVDGRLVDGTPRFVMRSSPAESIPWEYPTYDANGNTEDNGVAKANKKLIENMSIDDWAPQVSIDGADPQPLLDCGDVYRPADPSGLNMLSIITIGENLNSLETVGLVANTEITYASSDHMFIATNGWENSSSHTDIHSFSTSGADAARYEASGRVDGRLLNQYSLSASGDTLRVATTIDGNGGIGIEPMPMPIEEPCGPNENCIAIDPSEPATSPSPIEASVSESGIAILRQNGATLEQIGKVDGLGLTEQIKSVRYVGDIAYVVTFRQTDPFYVIDLSDPANPRTVGELKVPGFSSYLHPVTTGRTLGVGSDATNDGRIQGAKLSLYNVDDPTAPSEVTSVTFDDLEFLAGSDAKAFNFDEASGLALVPYYTACWGDSICNTSSNGVLVVRVTDDSITEVARISNEASIPSEAIDRAFVLGDSIISSGQSGIGVNNLDTFTSTGYLPLNAE